MMPCHPNLERRHVRHLPNWLGALCGLLLLHLLRQSNPEHVLVRPPRWSALLRGTPNTVSRATRSNVRRFRKPRQPYVLRSDLILVDSTKAHGDMAEEISAAVHLGVDAEWEPGKDTLSLLQVATPDKCYLVDLLPKCPEVKKKIPRLLKTIFCHPRIFAWDFREDFKRLDILKVPHRLLRDVIDLQPRAQYDILKMHRRPSLRHACAEILEVNLDKSMQVSSWSKRPLSDKQKYYAACDACVLLDLVPFITSADPRGTPNAVSGATRVDVPVPLVQGMSYVDRSEEIIVDAVEAEVLNASGRRGDEVAGERVLATVDAKGLTKI